MTNTAKRPDDRRIYISGLGTWLPSDRVTVQEAVDAGAYDAIRAVKDAFTSVRVERDAFPPEMGVEAARRALARVDLHSVGFLAWTSIHRHGHQTLWPPASFAHHELELDPNAIVFSLNQGCNGAFVAMKMGADHVRHHPGSSALVIGSDRFEDSLFDRWSSDHGTVYGDAASAVILSTSPGPIEVKHLDIEQGSALERMYRFKEPSAEDVNDPRRDHLVGSAKRAYLQEHGDGEIREVFAQTLGALRERLMVRHPLLERPARYIVYPNVGAGVSAGLYQDILGDLAEEHLWEYGRSIGHTGVSDQILGLAELLDRGALRPGDQVLLIGAGNGLSVATMLLEIRGE
ncbi:ketoacyl-ACP synthase III family protein [Leifsonia sp. McL0607]|uniref:ketoacyl-ACP synthase III family protein n=1 Tax=Leifsonia sp. McL0607 TaxID=3415672 RepID=UPI003CFA9895